MPRLSRTTTGTDTISRRVLNIAGASLVVISGALLSIAGAGAEAGGNVCAGAGCGVVWDRAPAAVRHKRTTAQESDTCRRWLTRISHLSYKNRFPRTPGFASGFFEHKDLFSPFTSPVQITPVRRGRLTPPWPPGRGRGGERVRGQPRIGRARSPRSPPKPRPRQSAAFSVW